jgi:hypothetical protein
VADDQDAREIDCPRCYETCGWCGDYRFYHGKIRLPGSRKYCTLPGYEPEGNGCPVCRGRRRVIASTIYTASGPQGIQTSKEEL